VVEGLLTHCHTPGGLRFFDWVDGVFRDRRPIRGAWSGILHNVISYPDPPPRARILSLADLVEESFFQESLGSCKGLYTLSAHTKDFLADRLPVPVESLVHPVPPGPAFSWDRYCRSPRIVMIGQWMRRFSSFASLETSIPKLLLNLGELHELLPGVQIKPYVDAREYDDLLASSAVYVDFHDVAACNVVLECIMRNTPILATDLPGNREYLGEDYPGLFRTPKEAIVRHGHLEDCHRYLVDKDKTCFSLERFIRQLQSSEIYRNYPRITL
jgi:hypothetical protein